MNIIITNKGEVAKSEIRMESLNSDHSVYEVIRVTEGVAIFLEDHYLRLQNSMQIQGISFGMDFQEFRSKIVELIRLNPKQEGNIKFIFSPESNEIQWIFSFIQHSYPAENDYLTGVSTNLLFAERENPNAKVIQNTVRERANRMIADQNLYEVLLVNATGQITEGSRSNVFFVKGHVFYTAPATLVLVGITRIKVLECLKELNFKLVEEAVKVSEIGQFDAVFLTGTSPKVLPVRSICEKMFDVQNSAVVRLIESYDKMIRDYIRNVGK